MAHEMHFKNHGHHGVLSMTHYDCVIIGSGLIGMTAAIALAQKMPKKCIALLDEKIPTTLIKPEAATLDTRTLALNYASVEYFKQCDIWPDIQTNACPIKQVQISEQGQFGRCLLRADVVGYEALGYVIEIHALHEVLLLHLARQPNIHSLHAITVTTLTKQQKCWQLTATHQGKTQHIAADYVILADGSESRLRDQLKIPCHRFDYEQTAIVSVIRPELAHHNTAYERFAQTEILALLPLTENRVGSVLTVTKSMQQDYLSMSNEEYLKKLQALFGFRLGKFQALGPRQSYPLQQCIAEQLVVDQLILLGNTAHTVNPIGAQGLNLGLAGIKDLVQCLTQNQSLIEFATRQQARCAKIKSFTHQAAHIFSSPALLTQMARSTALLALQHHATLKNKLTRQMMGLSG